MKKIYCIIIPAFLFLEMLSGNCIAQAPQQTVMVSKKAGVGFRAGLNFAKVSSNGDSVAYHYKPGLMIAVFLTPPHTGTVGYRSELLYSNQGFKYTEPDGNTGNITNDYLMLPQMMTVNITKYVQLQAGAFAGYLLRSKNSNAPPDNSQENKTYLDLMNRIDYGAAGGIEIHPFKGMILNARYNMGFSKLYKENRQANATPVFPDFLPFGNIDTKNAVIQFSVGYQL